jgi:hypothetical protein
MSIIANPSSPLLRGQDQKPVADSCQSFDDKDGKQLKDSPLRESNRPESVSRSHEHPDRDCDCKSPSHHASQKPDMPHTTGVLLKDAQQVDVAGDTPLLSLPTYVSWLDLRKKFGEQISPK